MTNQTRCLLCFAIVLAGTFADSIARAEDTVATKSLATDASRAIDKQDASQVRARNTVRAKGEITFDDIKLELENDEPYQDGKMTDGVRKLHEQKVKLRGYILPTSVFQQKGIKQFVLVRDNKECCFGPGAALYDCVIVNMEGDATADFTTRVVTVTGKFAIDIETYKYPDGKHYAIYKMSATSVE